VPRTIGSIRGKAMYGDEERTVGERAAWRVLTRNRGAVARLLLM
jgi:hypothetical protein